MCARGRTRRISHSCGSDAELAELVRALVELATRSARARNFPRNSKNCICGFRARKHREPRDALPEATRNARIQLAQAHARRRRHLRRGVHRRLHLLQPSSSVQGSAQFLLFTHATALAVGGGIYCLLSIHREKDLNTFDYQRITRLTPLQLALGKLFGAPSLLYFMVLCLVRRFISAVLSHLQSHFLFLDVCTFF